MTKKKKSKYGMNNVVSWGATVVIIGLMFKILHWPGATWFIVIGLGTEALLFFLIGCQPTPHDPDWTRVYPELKEDFEGALPSKSPSTGTTSFASTAALDQMLSNARIGPELISSLGDGLRTFAEKVSLINNVADASSATTEFTNKVKVASAGFENLSSTFEKASRNLSEMVNTNNIDITAYHKQVNVLVNNLAGLNAIYELELKDSGTHLNSLNKFHEKLSMAVQNLVESVEDSKRFKEELSKLSKNLATLNSVYGGMLTAMSQPRIGS